MSHEIIKNIFVTADRCVIVCHAPGNIQPQIFHEEEYGPLTELLRKEGYERLEEEILYLFFWGSGRTTCGTAVPSPALSSRSGWMFTNSGNDAIGTYRSDGSLSDIWPPISNL